MPLLSSSEKLKYSNVLLFGSVGYDNDLDLYRMDHRFYNPKSKRFITPDPYYLENPAKCIESPKECDLYSYGKNNPVSFVDPSGYKVEVGDHPAFFNVSTNPLNHRAIILKPDNPSDFKNHPLFSASGGKMATLGGQAFNGDISFKKPFGNLGYAPNYPGDHPSKLNNITTVMTPEGVSDTQFIKALINASTDYANNKPYFPIPELAGSNHYNSNSFVSGMLERASADIPHIDSIAPGYEKPLSRNNYVTDYYRNWL